MKITDPSSLRKILVPTDFSITSKRALNYAASLAQSLYSEIVIFHVIDVPVVTSGDMVFPVDYSSLETDAAVQLQNEKADLLSKYGNLSVSVSHSTGVATQEILQKSLKESFDMVIMGSNGTSGLVEAVFGSVTKNVIANCSCPVLTVPLNAPDTKPEKVAFATNFDEHELQSLFLLAEMLKPFDAEIHLLHVGEIKDMKHQDQLLNYFRGQVRTNINYENIRFHLIGGSDVEDEIEKFVISNKMDWLAIAKRKRNFFDRLTTKSLTNQMHHHSYLPLLVFHTTNKSATPLF